MTQCQLKVPGPYVPFDLKMRYRTEHISGTNFMFAYPLLNNKSFSNRSVYICKVVVDSNLQVRVVFLKSL